MRKCALLILSPLASLALLSCSAKNLREPSGIKSADIAFLLPLSANEKIEIELLNIQDLSRGKIVFNSASSDDADVARQLQNWREHLHWLVESAPENLPLSRLNDIEPIDQLRRLERALNLIVQSENNAIHSKQKQAAVIAAFNSQFKKTQNPNLALNNLPVPTAVRKSDAPARLRGPSSFKNPTSYSRRDTVEVNPNDKCEYQVNDGNTESEFSARCSGQALRVFYGDSAKIAAFNSKLLREFGYYVEATRFYKSLNFKYDRALIFNLAKLPHSTNAKTEKPNQPRALAATPNFSNRSHLNILLKSGASLRLDEALKKLLPYCRDLKSQCKTEASLLDQKFESEIDSIQFFNISLQNATPEHHHFGTWQIDDRRYDSFSDLQELYILSAFTGNWDVQSSANKLVWSAKNFSIFYHVGRINSGFGRGLVSSPPDLNAMHWELLSRKKKLLAVDGYHPRVSNAFVSNISIEQWSDSARAIAALDEDKLTRWLAEAGYSAAELMLAREKLVSLQKNMVEALGLDKEFPKLAGRKIDKNLNYGAKESSHSFELSDGNTIVVDNFGFSLKNGYLKSGP